MENKEKVNLLIKTLNDVRKKATNYLEKKVREFALLMEEDDIQSEEFNNKLKEMERLTVALNDDYDIMAEDNITRLQVMVKKLKVIATEMQEIYEEIEEE